MNASILNRIRGGREERGTALVLAVTMLATLMVMSYAFFRPTASAQKEVHSSMDDRRAFTLAEAGISEAIAALGAGQSGNVGTQNTPAALGGGILWVESTDLGNNQYQLVSTAAIGSGRHALSAVVSVNVEEDSLFVATLNSKETMTCNQGVVIDSFDSSVGDYASQAVNSVNGFTCANTNGDVKSNMDIILNNDATVLGDATPGPGYGVTFNLGSYVDGSTAPSSEPFDFPPIDFPTGYTNYGSVSLSGAAPAVLPSGDYEFTSFTLNRATTLTIEGPANIIVDDFTGGKEANLLVDATNGPVTFYVRDTYSHIAGFECDAVPGSPMAMAFLIDGRQDVVFPNLTPVRGAYYAPNSNIVFSNGNEAWGSFAANRIDMANDMKFHFDETLADYWKVNNGSPQGPATLLAFAEVAVDVPELMLDRRDALDVMGLDGVVLQSPYDSWLEKLTAGTGGGQTTY